MIENSILTNPIPLLAIKNPKLIKKINAYLPYSSAFEVECMQQPTFNIQAFRDIPDIMAVQCDTGEQRFRVPSGLKGLVCLYHISEQLKLNSELNPMSGIHYHCDCTDIWPLITSGHREKVEWILKELETWNPEYTAVKTKYWLKFNSLQTMEYRVGEMTFEYPILAKRMIHCNDMTRRFKLGVLEGPSKLKLENLHKKLKELQTDKQDFIFKDVAQEIVKSRTRRI